MAANNSSSLSVWRLLAARLRNRDPRQNGRTALRNLFLDLKDFVLESTPQRRRLRYGDIDYDCDNSVNTTAATVTWKSRLLGAIAGGPYQPCDAPLFHESLSQLPIDFSEFMFIDIGSGKGRALLLASDYPFRRILGVELLPELNRIAWDNIRSYHSDSQKCFALESVCVDATEFRFPNEPTLLFLFNPVPERALEKIVKNLERSLEEYPRYVGVVYHNPVLAHLLLNSKHLELVSGELRTAVFRSKSGANSL